MAKATKKESRVMKVTMDADEFEKFDRGITHSDNGVRTEEGRLSALPDIAPISEDDLPQREVVRTEVVYSEHHQSKGRRFVEAAMDFAWDVTVDVLSDPDIQEKLAELGKTFWDYKVRPLIDSTIQCLKGDKKLETKALRLKLEKEVESAPEYQVIVNDPTHGKITVSGEQAQMLVDEMRNEVQRLSALIFLLSNIVVKDEKTQEEYVLEQAYIKQLACEESRAFMEMLLKNPSLLDQETVSRFTDYMNGYVRSGDQMIAIPIETVESK